jgi:endonuclease G
MVRGSRSRWTAALLVLALLGSGAHAWAIPALERAAVRLQGLGIKPKLSLRAARHLALGMPSDARRDKDDDFLLVRNGYVLSYNATRSSLNWVSWAVQESDLGPAERGDPFRPDPTLPARFYVPRNKDFKLPGYSRGHMVRSGERTATQRENDKTFVFPNMLVQAQNNNAGPWNAFENFYRDEVKKGYTAQVIAGGVFGEAPVPKRGVDVPSDTWKIVALLRPGQTIDQIDDKTRIVAISVPNNNDTVKVEQSWERYRTSIGAIEAKTGLRFLDHLPPGMADYFRNRIDDGPVPPPGPRDFVAYNYGEGPGQKYMKLLKTQRRGTVKWYSNEKKFGFITTDEGEDLFVHATGRKAPLKPGLPVEFDIVQGRDGRRFAIEVTAPMRTDSPFQQVTDKMRLERRAARKAAAEPDPTLAPVASPTPQPVPVHGRGTVKSFFAGRGFGFIRTDDGKDVFVHVTGSKTELKAGLPVEFDVVDDPDGRPRAVAVTAATIAPASPPSQSAVR